MDTNTVFLLAAIGLYFLAMIAIGLYASRKNTDLDDYMLAGRDMKPSVAALSAGASDMSGWLLMGLPGAIYAAGLVEGWMAVGLTVGAWVNWRVVAPRLRSYTEVAGNSITIPSFLENRFKDRTHILRIVAGLIILVFFTFYVSSGMVAGGKFVESTFGPDSFYAQGININYLTGMLVVAGITVLYTLFGGFLGASLTDVAQGVLMFLSLLAVPIVNVLGVMAGDRYLPDRRDLNRSFPGSARGSLASRIAHLMMTEVIGRCTVGIDLHTGADRRSNLPQIRCDLEDPQTRALAEAFGAPVLFHARLRDGSLRAAARETGARVLLYEAGEAWRFDEYAIAPGVDGVLRVLAALDMVDPADVGLTEPGPDAVVDAPGPLPGEVPEERTTDVPEATDATGEDTEAVHPDVVDGEQDTPYLVWQSTWVRARADGLVHLDVSLGERVSAGDRIGALYNSFGRRLAHVKAELTGVVIGRTEAPLVHRGDALVHIGGWDA